MADVTEPVYVTPVGYRVTVMPEACLRHERSDLHWWNLRVQSVAALFHLDSDDWLVTNEQQYVLGAYPSPGAALDAAREFAPKVTLNDLTAVEVLVRHRERGLGCCRG